MELGAFSISLVVKDIAASKAFYEKFGFEPFAGDTSQRWLILKNGPHAIGLFQGMFDKNILTLNPGWDGNASKLNTFTDVRDLQRTIEGTGCAAKDRSRRDVHGASEFYRSRPGREPILVDQHV
jgi:lactoylglutathione lyase